MARPIKDTPVLKGKDAVRFVLTAQSFKPASEEERNRARKAFEYFSKIANFPL